ncbi:MAG TPA: hypothetical protein VHE54_05200 [Puia sp.]|nr:hypothetical protein [Puia sp.]
MKRKMAILSVLLGCIGAVAVGQVEIKGTVYDESKLFAMPGVSVLGTSGQGTTTDSVGEYHILLHPGDSIYFSYLGRYTGKIPVSRIVKNYPLDMSLAVRVDSLPLVVVRPRPYRYDSAENRDEYRNVFDYQPENVIFGARRNRQMLELQQRLIEEEQEKYVSYRFNKLLVRKITGLRGPALDTFMKLYRPTYQFIRNCENDYEFYKYIKDAGLYFQAHPQ